MKIIRRLKIFIFNLLFTCFIKFSVTIKLQTLESNNNFNTNSVTNSNKEEIREEIFSGKFKKLRESTSQISPIKKIDNIDQNNSQSNIINEDFLKVANMALKQHQPGFEKKIDLDKMGDIIFQSWINFFKYNDHIASDKNAKIKLNQQKKFFTNGEYREQLKLYPGKNYSEKDNDGEYKYISDPNKFYLVAFKNSVVIYQTKIVNIFFKINYLI
jgi:hypothetical protein